MSIFYTASDFDANVLGAPLTAGISDGLAAPAPARDPVVDGDLEEIVDTGEPTYARNVTYESLRKYAEADKGGDLYRIVEGRPEASPVPIDGTAHGTEGDDVINGTTDGPLFEIGGEAPDEYDDVIFGGGGNDSLRGGAGDDEIHGEAGDDWLDGGADADRLFGGDGTDTLRGGSGEDSLDGGADYDVLWGGSENDVLAGGDGDDVLYGEWGDDEIHGEAGDDWLEGGDDADRLFGGDGMDSLRGLHGDDSLVGGAGDDVLGGHWGADELHGGEGNDILTGGSGQDQMWGGGGADLFANNGTDGLFDIVHDFTSIDSARGHHFDVDANGHTVVYDDLNNVLLKLADYDAIAQGINLIW